MVVATWVFAAVAGVMFIVNGARQRRWLVLALGIFVCLLWVCATVFLLCLSHAFAN